MDNLISWQSYGIYAIISTRQTHDVAVFFSGTRSLRAPVCSRAILSFLKAKTREVARVRYVMLTFYFLTGPCDEVASAVGVTIALKRKTVCLGHVLAVTVTVLF